jgi:hypothetical protein
MHQQCNHQRLKCGLEKLKRYGSCTTGHAACAAKATGRCACRSDIDSYGWYTRNDHTHRRRDPAQRCCGNGHSRAWPASRADRHTASDPHAQTGANTHAAPATCAHYNRDA